MSVFSEKFRQARSLYNNNLWKGRILLTTLIVFLLLVIVRISLPYTIVYSAVYWLGKQGITSQIDDISINIIRGTFSVHNATGNKDGDTVFKIGRASIDWEWAPLSTKTIAVKHVLLDEFDLRAKQYSDGLIIAGITIKNDGTIEQPPATDEQPVAWSTALNQIDFKNLNFCFMQHNTALASEAEGKPFIDYCANAQAFTWQGSIGLVADSSAEAKQDPRLHVDGSLELSQLNLINNLLDADLIKLGELSLSNINIDGINDIKLDAININKLQLLQRSGHATHKHAVDLNNINIKDIDFSNLDTVRIKSISLDTPLLSLAKDKSGAWKYQQWIPEPGSAPEQPEQQPTSEEAVFNINVGSVSITAPQLCYEQPAIPSDTLPDAIDYCLDIASSDWNGDIAIATPAANKPLGLLLTGDLKISGFVTTNNLLQRDLLAFDELTINKINIQSQDNLAFDNLSLKNVTGLELTSAEDKHTLAVSSLDIATFSYASNTLSIDKATINDLRWLF